MALEYKKDRARDVLKKHVNIENKQHKHELEGCAAAARPLEWPKKSQPDDYYINEENMYELLFSSQQPKAKDFRRHYCNVLFPHVRQQLLNKMKEDHQQAIEEKDATIALLTDDLKYREHDNVALQVQRDVYKERFQNVKTPLPILGQTMFLMQKIQAKITLL